MERKWSVVREERPVKMEEGREERLLEQRAGGREMKEREMEKRK